MSEQIKIGGRLHSIAEGNVATGANEILDDSKGKKQSVINQETDAELERLNNAKQDNLTFDTTPTEGSTNPITSGGVYAADEALQQAIEAILLLIPSAASALNQLADKNFVNSTVATDSATFRGTYNVVTDLELHYDATHQQIATALLSKIQEADNNDYCFVQIPVSDSSGDIRVTERYKFNGTAWAYEYDLNNSGFTAAQWAAINSTITLALVQKLSALPTAAELAIALNGKQNTLTFDSTPTAGSSNPVTSAGLYAAFAAINATIPAGASADNKLVAETRLAEYVASIINALDATYNVTSTDGHVNVRLTQVDGAITSVEVLTNDIASAAALNTLTGRVSTAESDIDALQDAYAALTQSDVVIVNGDLPSSGQQQNIIYRQPDQYHTPPQFYSDYMWNGTTWVFMATYNNAIDPRPKKGSQNLVTSGGVFDNIGALDVSELNATENPHTLATYADLSAALAAIPSDYQKGGMSVKFVQSSDNKYVQFRCTADNFSTTESDWQKQGAEVSVLQNTITGNDTLNIGGNKASVFADADKLIKLKRIGIFGNPTDLVVGDVIYSTSLGKIVEVLAINESQVVSNYREIPFMKGAIYQCYGTLYIYDETEQTIVPIIKLENNGEKITFIAGTGISQTFASGKVADLVSLINNYSFTWKDGYYLTRLNGELEDEGYSYCDYVPVLPNTKLYLYANFAAITSYCFYDKYKNFLSGSRNETGNDQFDGLIDTPESAAYIRISSKIGEKGKVILFNSVLKTLSDIASADVNKLSKDNECTQGNKLDWNSGYFLTNTNEVAPNGGYAYCDYIPVVPLSKVHIKSKFTANAAYCFYDKNHNFISGHKNETGVDLFNAVVDVPINANYIRISSENSAIAIADVATLIVSSLSNKEEMFASVATFENFVTMGDSYGAGAILKNSSVTDTISVSWGKQLERLVGSECFNCCRGGQWTGGFLTDQLQGSLNQVLNLGIKKLYFYCLGINDAIRIAQGTHTLGTIDDIKNDYTQNPATFYGNYGKIIAQVLTYAPDAMHVVCTVGLTTANCPELAGVNPDIDSINTALIAIANKFSLPCIILNNDSYFGSDYYINGMLGGHPTAVQYGGYAKAMERLFASCVLNNYNYFKVYKG